MGVTIPHYCGVALLSSPTAACEVEHALAVSRCPLVVVEATGMVERVELAALSAERLAEDIFVELPSSLLVIPSIGMSVHRLRHLIPVAVERFTAVAPPGIEAIAEELAVGILPIEFAGIRVKGVVDRVLEHIAPFPEVVGFGTVLRVGPDAYHQLGVKTVDGIGESLGTGIETRVHLHVSPALWPVVPVLYDHVERHVTPAVFAHRGDELSRRGVALFRLDIAKGVAGQHLYTPCEVSVAAHHLVGPFAGNEVIVELSGCLHLHGERVGAGCVFHRAAYVEEQAVALWREKHGDGDLQVVLSEPQRLAEQVHIVLHV